MIRAMLMFSVVLVSVLNAGCQKEKRPTPTTVPRPLLRPPLPGAMPPPIPPGANASGDQSLNANKQTQAQVPASTIRAQKADLGDGNTTQSDVSQGVPATSKTTPGSTDYNYNPDGTATLKYPPQQAPAAAAQQPAAPVAAAPAAAADPQPDAAAPAGAALPAATTATVQSEATAQTSTAPAEAPADQTAAATANVTSAPTPPQPEQTTQSEVVSPTLYSVKEGTDPNWAPGLARDKAPEPIFTNGVRSDGARYTDGKFDSIMASLWNGFRADADLLKNNEALAPTITNVQLVSNSGLSFTLAVDLNENGKMANLVFQTKIGRAQNLKKLETAARKPKTAKSIKELAQLVAEARTVELELQDNSQSAAPLLYRYHAIVLCSDKKVRTCENAVIELGRFDKNATKNDKPLATAYIVHRLGPAVVTFASSDSANVPMIETHQKFKAFLNATAKKVCLAEKQEAKDDQKAQLEKICANDEGTANGAAQVLMRTWAIAGGGSKAQVIFPDTDDKNDVYFTKSLMISGEMVLVSDKVNSAATVTDRSNLGRDSWFKEKTVQVKNSDGAGALNLEMTFEGEGGATETERISVISNFSPSKAPHLAKKKQPDQAGA